MSDTVRLSIEVPRDINEQLARICPWGTKADSIRAIVELFIRAWLQNSNIASELLNGRCRLIVDPPNAQSLNAPDGSQP